MRPVLAGSLVLVFALACGGGDASRAEGPPRAPAATPTRVETPAAGAPTNPGGDAPAAAAAPPPGPAEAAPPARAAWSPPRLPPCDDIALLVAHDFEYVRRNHCALCRGQTPWACELDWPTNDVPPCSAWDDYRNGIYAYYGYPFQKAEWRERFKSFYVENPDFDESLLSPAAARNVVLFKAMAAEKRGCG